MGKVIQLDEKLIDKIAAGEVVENPASVAKELIENSIDANADSIEIEIKEGGKSLVKVRDNGDGMSKEDAILCIRRHATSKIKDENDLFAIKTLGFRGEALASISAVSEFSLLTRRKDDLKGTEIVVKKGVDVNDKGGGEGTTIKVQNLFYNVPARKKFLRNMSLELASVVDVVTRYALAYNNISFKLINEGKVLLNTNKTENYVNTIVSLYGSEVGKNMIEIESKDDMIEIGGFIGKPSIARNDRLRQNIYLNGRYIKSKELSNAVKEGYRSLLFLDKEPIFVLKLNLDANKVDVNVHPRKEIVKISQLNNICQRITEAVNKTLGEANLVVESDLKQSTAKAQQQYSFSTDKQETLGDGLVQSGSVYDNIKNNIKDKSGEQIIETKHIGPFKIFGQVNKTFIVAENAEGLLVIDQHAAEERVNYEKLMKMLKEKAVKKQTLLKPMVLETSPAEFQVTLNYIDQLSKLGYDIEEYGKNNLIMRSIPFVFDRQSRTLFNDLINELKDISTKKLDEEIEERIIRFSCRKSIKAGEDMSMKEIHELIQELDKCELPFTCPHGRPTIISISLAEMEKKFKRTG